MKMDVGIGGMDMYKRGRGLNDNREIKERDKDKYKDTQKQREMSGLCCGE